MNDSIKGTTLNTVHVVVKKIIPFTCIILCWFSPPPPRGPGNIAYKLTKHDTTICDTGTTTTHHQCFLSKPSKNNTPQQTWSNVIAKAPKPTPEKGLKQIDFNTMK